VVLAFETGVNQKLKPRILAIDDDPGVGILLCRVFEEIGRYAMTFESDPYRAMQTARAFRPDILIIDINMPGKTGMQLALEIRSEPWLRYRPIVFFTGLATWEKPSGWETGIAPTEFLPKGVPTQTIINTVDRLAAAIGLQ
jgi:CheY-like chemotaxis protein